MICIINENCKFRATGSKNKHTLAAKQFIYYVQTLYTVYYSFFFFVCVIRKLLIIVIRVNGLA